MQFRNPSNGYVEEVRHPGLWCLLFGCLYFAARGVWTHAIVSFVLALMTAGISWLVYPFFAREIMTTFYRRRGWVPIDGDGSRWDPPAGLEGDTKVCPDCAEDVRAEARLCRFCGYRFDKGRDPKFREA